MIENYYLFSAGLLALIFAFGHASWGQKNVMGPLSAAAVSVDIKHAIFTNWHQTTSVMFLSGVVLLISAVHDDAAASRLMAWLVGGVNLGNLAVFVGGSLFKNRPALRQALPQMVVMSAFIALIIAGVAQR